LRRVVNMQSAIIGVPFVVAGILIVAALAAHAAR